jgi:hypothetical protein
MELDRHAEGVAVEGDGRLEVVSVDGEAALTDTCRRCCLVHAAGNPALGPRIPYRPKPARAARSKRSGTAVNPRRHR